MRFVQWYSIETKFLKSKFIIAAERFFCPEFLPNTFHWRNNDCRLNTLCRREKSLARHWRNRNDERGTHPGKQLYNRDPDQQCSVIFACHFQTTREPSTDIYSIICRHIPLSFVTCRTPDRSINSSQPFSFKITTEMKFCYSLALTTVCDLQSWMFVVDLSAADITIWIPSEYCMHEKWQPDLTIQSWL